MTTELTAVVLVAALAVWLAVDPLVAAPLAGAGPAGGAGAAEKFLRFFRRVY